MQKLREFSPNIISVLHILSLVLCFQPIFHPLKWYMMILRERCEKFLLPAQRDDGLKRKAIVLVLG